MSEKQMSLNDTKPKATQDAKPQQPANKSLFATLAAVDVNKHTYNKDVKLRKGGTKTFTYLQWAWAWSYLMFVDPHADLKFKQYPEYDFTAHQVTGRKVDYMDTANGAYVTAVLTVKGITREQSLPVMDYKNSAMMHPDMMSINKTKQRAFVKCLALFGLGLSLFGMTKKSRKGQFKSNKPYGSSSGQSANGRSETDTPTTKQQKTIKWLMPKVGAKLTDGDANKFNALKRSCGTFDGASKFLDFLFEKKKAFNL